MDFAHPTEPPNPPVVCPGQFGLSSSWTSVQTEYLRWLIALDWPYEPFHRASADRLNLGKCAYK